LTPVASRYISVHVEETVDVPVEDVIDDLEAIGYVVIDPAGDPAGDDDPAIVTAYEAFTSGNLERLDRALRDLFDIRLRRLVGDPPWRAA
jgi:hypothetical protein